MKTSINEILETTDRIVAYGCSFTAGSELMDHVHLKMSFDKCNEIKQRMSSSLKNVRKFIDYFKIEEADALNRQHSWVAYLSRKLNKPFENRAEGGSGLDQIYFKIYTDLNAGLISKNDLVIVGLTGISRIVTFNHDKVQSLLLGWQISEKNSDDKKLIELLTDEWLIFNYYKTLKLLIQLSDKINIRFQFMMPNARIDQYDSLKCVSQYITEIWNEIQPLVLFPDAAFCLAPGQQMCGFKHWPVQSHIDLANKIYKNIINNTDI
jgi:hypothetical protein